MLANLTFPENMRASMVLVDARPLQDPDYQYRGVGQHSAVILHALRYSNWNEGRPTLVGLVDSRMRPLPTEYAMLFDEIDTPGKGVADDAWYLCLSPMTHDPTWASRYLLDPKLIKITLFYDLIQLQFPDRYLATLESQMGFALNLAWLTKFDLFSAISAFTAEDLVKTMNIDANRVSISYVAVRRALEPLTEKTLPFRNRSFVLFAGGGDPRKNPECVLTAHARSKALRKASIKLKLFGNYGSEARNHFRMLYAKEGGNLSDLIFLSHLTDEELRDAYGHALVTVVASYAEGFSIPIVESNASGTPVLASNVGAHPELVHSKGARFDPDNPDELRGLLENVCTKPDNWALLVAEQQHLWKGFTIERIATNFISGLAGATQIKALSPASPHIVTHVKPTISVLSPFPPSPSGVADYSASTLGALAELADIHVYSDTTGVRLDPIFKALSPVRQAAFSARRNDAVVSVLGNSHFHTTILDYFMDYGGASIAHDARMINYYVHVKGMEAALEIAKREGFPTASHATVAEWLGNQELLPTLFMKDISDRSSPLMVHSPTTAGLIERLYGKKPVVLPFAQYNQLNLSFAQKSARAKIREEIGFESNEIVLCTFGYVSDDKAPEELIWTLKTLRDWNIRVKLYFCGQPHGDLGTRLKLLASELGIRERVIISDDFVDNRRYKNLLFAADVGIQLRTYGLGGLSGALNDCIAAALPSVTNEHLAVAMDAPSFVRRVPDKLSPILIAEAVVDIIQSGDWEERPLTEALRCAEMRSPKAYASQMLQALGIA